MNPLNQNSPTRPGIHRRHVDHRNSTAFGYCRIGNYALQPAGPEQQDQQADDDPTEPGRLMENISLRPSLIIPGKFPKHMGPWSQDHRPELLENATRFGVAPQF